MKNLLGKVDSTKDGILFYDNKTTSARVIRQALDDFTPTFIEDIIAQNQTIAQQVNISCGYVQSCVVATLTSGLESIGNQSKANAQQYQTTLTSLSMIYFNG